MDLMVDVHDVLGDFDVFVSPLLAEVCLFVESARGCIKVGWHLNSDFFNAHFLAFFGHV